MNDQLGWNVKPTNINDFTPEQLRILTEAEEKRHARRIGFAFLTLICTCITAIIVTTIIVTNL